VTDFYTSHEALLLGYEEALTRVDSITGDWYATSATCSGSATAPASPTAPMSNSARRQEPDRPEMRPVAGRPTTCCVLIDQAEPENEAGPPDADRRFGADKVAEHLPRLIRAVDPKREGRQGRLVLRPDARQHDQ
jgi:3-deoxy-7-phosphoheptulonate synthase